jgi:hypothetical protein
VGAQTSCQVTPGDGLSHRQRCPVLLQQAGNSGLQRDVASGIDGRPKALPDPCLKVGHEDIGFGPGRGLGDYAHVGLARMR